MEIARIEIPKYIRQVKMSNKQRPVYFRWNGITFSANKLSQKIPKSCYKNRNFCNLITTIDDLKDDYVIGIMINKNLFKLYTGQPTKKKLVLCVKNENFLSPILANKNVAGLPKYYLINGQDIYNGYLSGPALGNVMNAIKNCYLPHIKDLKPISTYPIHIVCEIHDTIKSAYNKSYNDLGGRWDVDNLAYPYLKAFPDLLTKERKIKDDDRLYMPSTIPAYFIPIDNHENRKLVFIISTVTRPEILENETFKRFHGESYESEDNKLVDNALDFGVEVESTPEQEEKICKLKEILKENGKM